MPKEEFTLENIKKFSLIVVPLVGLIHGLATRYTMDPDGVSYLDVGVAYFTGDLDSAINSYWSPLFSWIQGLALYASGFDPNIESIVVHMVNFFIFVISYLTFSYFMDGFIEYIEKKNTQEELRIEKKYLLLLGNGLFLWSAMNLITISILTPDMLVAAILYMIFGILIRVKNGRIDYPIFILLGFTLGLGYLSKAFMFPMALIFLILTTLVINNFKVALPRLLLSIVFFLAVSMPFALTISKQEGHFTFGESGKMNWAWYLTGSYEYWRGGWKGNEELVHPSRKINEEPIAYEYSTPIKGSYPPWFAPAYWFEGIKPHFSIKGQLGIISWGLGRFYKLFVEMQGAILAVFFLLLFLSSNLKRYFLDLCKEWALLIPCFAAFSAYLLVATELRYLGAYNVILLLTMFSSLIFKKNKEVLSFKNKSLAALIALLFITGFLSNDFLLNGRNYSAVSNQIVASEMQKYGIKPGDDVAAVGVDYGIYWAHLAKVRIIAEVPGEERDAFWSVNHKSQEEILKKFKSYGAKAVVAEIIPNSVKNREGWVKLGETPYHLYTF